MAGIFSIGPLEIAPGRLAEIHNSRMSRPSARSVLRYRETISSAGVSVEKAQALPRGFLPSGRQNDLDRVLFQDLPDGKRANR